MWLMTDRSYSQKQLKKIVNFFQHFHSDEHDVLCTNFPKCLSFLLNSNNLRQCRTILVTYGQLPSLLNHSCHDGVNNILFIPISQQHCGKGLCIFHTDNELHAGGNHKCLLPAFLRHSWVSSHVLILKLPIYWENNKNCMAHCKVFWHLISVGVRAKGTFT